MYCGLLLSSLNIQELQGLSSVIGMQQNMLEACIRCRESCQEPDRTCDPCDALSMRLQKAFVLRVLSESQGLFLGLCNLLMGHSEYSCRRWSPVTALP